MSSSIITTGTPTAQQLLVDKAARLARQQVAAFQQVQRVFADVALFIWSDPTKAQDAFNAFTQAGFRAGDLFLNAAAYAALVQALTGVAPASPIPEGWTYTINANGTVTVTAPPAPSSQGT